MQQLSQLLTMRFHFNQNIAVVPSSLVRMQITYLFSVPCETVASLVPKENISLPSCFARAFNSTRSKQKNLSILIKSNFTLLLWENTRQRPFTFLSTSQGLFLIIRPSWWRLWRCWHTLLLCHVRTFSFASAIGEHFPFLTPWFSHWKASTLLSSWLEEQFLTVA